MTNLPKFDFIEASPEHILVGLTVETNEKCSADFQRGRPEVSRAAEKNVHKSLGIRFLYLKVEVNYLLASASVYFIELLK